MYNLSMFQKCQMGNLNGNNKSEKAIKNPHSYKITLQKSPEGIDHNIK